LDQILARLLARHPRDRYQTASELIVDLERSRLAAPVPSYADPDLALQDPWVRVCMASSAQPTQPDLSQVPLQPADGRQTGGGGMPSPHDAAAQPDGPAWIVRYPGRDGRWRRLRISQEQLRQRLQEGRVPERTEICRHPREGFKPLRQHPEFGPLLPP